MTDEPFTPAHRHEFLCWLNREGTRGSPMRDAIEAALAEIARLTALKALLPRIAESLTNDTLTDTPDQLSDVDVPCACDDCDGLRIDALKAVYKLLMSEAQP